MTERSEGIGKHSTERSDTVRLAAAPTKEVS
jgi:hypothetical protein